mmetsp:Transcript_5922/g.8372  ORF Transcript_5922/g.8372 Transcript_5922/m.8372 type:complete len:288 (-) Transcript_5922:37-900(-)
MSAQQTNSDDSVCWYFAIGSMMNKTSLKLRGIHPIESKPAELIDYELFFFYPNGMAEAVPKKGSTFHGVVHKISEDEMLKLDKLESTQMGIVRKPAKAILYSNEEKEELPAESLDVTVYCRGDSMSREIAKPPARYVEIMIEGAISHGVDDAFIAFLRSLEVQPRTCPEDYLRIQVPKGVQHYSLSELEQIKNSLEKENHLIIAINGKVIRYTGSMPNSFVTYYRQSKSLHIESIWAAVKYDPMFGCPAEIENFSRRHSADIEDQLLRRKDVEGWECIGTINQRYID